MKKILYFLLIQIFSISVCAQKSIKTTKQLTKQLTEYLNKGESSLLIPLFCTPQLYTKISPSLQGKTDEDILGIVKPYGNSVEDKMKMTREQAESFGIDTKKITFKQVRESNLSAVAADYYALEWIVSYQNTLDTLKVEVLKNAKKYCIIDLPENSLVNIIRKHSSQTARQYIATAENLASQNKYEQAIEALKKASFLEPSNKEIPFEKGLLYKNMGDTLMAVALLRKAIAIDYQFYPARYELAVMVGDSGEKYNYYGAIEDLRLCVENNYKVTSAAILATKLYYKEFENAFQYSIDNSEIYGKNETLDMAAKALENLTESSDEDKIQIYWIRTNIYLLDSLSYELARKDLENILKIKPNHHQALYELAWLDNELGNFKMALASAEKSYGIEKSVETLNEIAYAHMKVGNYKKAIEHYNNIWAEGEQYQTDLRYANRGYCYQMLKNNKQACSDYKKAVELGFKEEKIITWLKKNCK